jgi:hypothetical protein
MSDAAIFNDASQIIKNALQKTHQLSSDKTRLSERAFEIALKQLV